MTTSRSTLVLAAGIGLASLWFLVLGLPMDLNPADESYFLVGASRAAAGEVLYRDYFEILPPLGFWLFGAAFRLAGENIVTARTLMGLLDATTAVLVFVLGCRVGSRGLAAVAALMATAGCFPVWNMASAHWLSTTLALGAAVAVTGSRPGGPGGFAWGVAGMLVGAVVCNQQQKGFWLVLWLGVAIALRVLATAPADRRRVLTRAVLGAGVGGSSLVAVVLGTAVLRAGVAPVWDALVVFILDNYRRRIVGRVGWGGSELGPSLLRVYAWPWLPGAMAAVVLAEPLGLAADGKLGERDRRLVRATAWALAAALVGASLYYPDFIHLAFVAPASLVVGVSILDRALAALARLAGPTPARVAHALLVAAGLVLVLDRAVASRAIAWERNPATVESAFGTYRSSPGQKQIVEEMQAIMAGVPAGRRRIFVYPGDAWLYLTLPGRNSTPYSLLLPGYSAERQFRRTLDSLERDPPDFVVINRAFTAPDDPVRLAVEAEFTHLATVAGLLDVHGRRPPAR